MYFYISQRERKFHVIENERDKEGNIKGASSPWKRIRQHSLLAHAMYFACFMYSAALYQSFYYTYFLSLSRYCDRIPGAAESSVQLLFKHSTLLHFPYLLVEICISYITTRLLTVIGFASIHAFCKSCICLESRIHWWRKDGIFICFLVPVSAN